VISQAVWSFLRVVDSSLKYPRCSKVGGTSSFLAFLGMQLTLEAQHPSLADRQRSESVRYRRIRILDCSTCSPTSKLPE